MANRSLFRTQRTVPNEAQGVGYALSPRQQLAQYAATGCLSGTFYASADDQLDRVLGLCEGLPAEFLAKVAVYARQRGYMKDMPALLCAVLATRGPDTLPRVFHHVIDNGRMLRNFVQIVRSGVVGRRSLGTMPRRLVREWLEQRSDAALVAASVGRAPSLADVVRMVHPKPSSPSRSALYAYLTGREYAADQLPESLRAYEAFKQGARASVPDVPFLMLTSLDLTHEHWRAIARQVPWQALRMNLNTFQRHGVFRDRKLTAQLANRLRDCKAIERAKVFPYQLMAAWMNIDYAIPAEIREALQDAMEIATSNVPRFSGRVYVCVDVSGSMHSSVSGYGAAQPSKVRCVDAAALFAATIVRRNAMAEVIPFAESVRTVQINPRDAVMTNAQKLSSLPSGGTDCSAPLRHLLEIRAEIDTVIMISDNESWMDGGPSSTGTLRAWREIQSRNPGARLVCLDIQPYATVQAPPSASVLHVGGFSDQVFRVVRSFLSASGPDHWVEAIDRINY